MSAGILIAAFAIGGVSAYIVWDRRREARSMVYWREQARDW